MKRIYKTACSFFILFFLNQSITLALNVGTKLFCLNKIKGNYVGELLKYGGELIITGVERY